MDRRDKYGQPIGPSERHIWSTFGREAARCDRCGGTVHYRADARGPYYCNPNPAWLREHPEDDRGTR